MSEDGRSKRKVAPYLQNRELSWLEFNKRVLDQGADDTVPLLERLSFISIFWSNLQEFFMVRVGSLTDLALLKQIIIDKKSGMTPAEQLDAIYERCRQLYPYYETCYRNLNGLLAQEDICNLEPKELNEEQRTFLETYFHTNVVPFLSPQIVNVWHPFPHLETGALYVVVRLDEQGKKKKHKAEKGGADGVTLGIIPLPRQCERIVKLPGHGCQFMLLEQIIEMHADAIFSMYKVKHTNIICVTRNADLDIAEGEDEESTDYREHMKRILKKRSRLAPVRLESQHELSPTVKRELLGRLKLKEHQCFASSVPLNMDYVFDLRSHIPEEQRARLTYAPFSPAWPACLDRTRSVINQVVEGDVMLSYPYESIEAFAMLLREAAVDPAVVSIKITLYRLAKQSRLAEALLAAAENGKDVTAIFELRARFDESNNIEWSQRFEQAGCNVLYGFRDLKVHSKICCITRQTPEGLQYITQIGTGNYNEKTSALYTDFSFITADPAIGRDATLFFRNLALENLSDEYGVIWVAPLMIKQRILEGIDEQIERHKQGLPSGLFFKTNSITDLQIIEKIVEASQAGVKCTLLVRGISCIVPGLADYTANVCVVSIVGRLLEHSRIYCFGPLDGDTRIYLSSADLMTRNMDKRVEVAWPVLNEKLRDEVIGYIGTCMSDTAKLRDLLPNKDYTPLRFFATEDPTTGLPILFDSQEYLIAQAQDKRLEAAELEEYRRTNRAMPLIGPRSADLIHKAEKAAKKEKDAASKKKRKKADASKIPEVLPQGNAQNAASPSEASSGAPSLGDDDDASDRVSTQTAQSVEYIHVSYGMKIPQSLREQAALSAAITQPIDPARIQAAVEGAAPIMPVSMAMERYAKNAHGRNEVLYDSPDTFFEKPVEDNQIVMPQEKKGFFSKLFGSD